MRMQDSLFYMHKTPYYIVQHSFLYIGRRFSSVGQGARRLLLKGHGHRVGL